MNPYQILKLIRHIVNSAADEKLRSQAESDRPGNRYAKCVFAIQKLLIEEGVNEN